MQPVKEHVHGPLQALARPGQSSARQAGPAAGSWYRWSAKLDLFATRLKSNSIKPREIDETLKTLTAETENPDVVGDIAALHTPLLDLLGLAALVVTRLGPLAACLVERGARRGETLPQRIGVGLVDADRGALVVLPLFEQRTELVGGRTPVRVVAQIGAVPRGSRHVLQRTPGRPRPDEHRRKPAIT